MSLNRLLRFIVMFAILVSPAYCSSAQLQSMLTSSLIKRLRKSYDKLEGYSGELSMLKNGVKEKAFIEFKKGNSRLYFTSGPKKGKSLKASKGLIYQKVFGIFVPIVVPSKVFWEANGDMGPGYIIARLTEEADNIKDGIPLKTSIKEGPEYIIIKSDYVGDGNYRYRHAEVYVDQSLLLPVKAAYDTNGDNKFNEIYEFNFHAFKFAKAKIYQ